MADLKQSAISVIRALRDEGYQAYLVGGCVRDLLLHRKPADYDVATDALPDDVMRLFPETYAVGAQFGVVLVPAEEKRFTGFGCFRGFGCSLFETCETSETSETFF